MTYIRSIHPSTSVHSQIPGCTDSKITFMFGWVVSGVLVTPNGGVRVWNEDVSNTRAKLHKFLCFWRSSAPRRYLYEFEVILRAHQEWMVWALSWSGVHANTAAAAALMIIPFHEKWLSVCVWVKRPFSTAESFCLVLFFFLYLLSAADSVEKTKGKYGMKCFVGTSESVLCAARIVRIVRLFCIVTTRFWQFVQGQSGVFTIRRKSYAGPPSIRFHSLCVCRTHSTHTKIM